jgi:hypothetical protein
MPHYVFKWAKILFIAFFSTFQLLAYHLPGFLLGISPTLTCSFTLHGYLWSAKVKYWMEESTNKQSPKKRQKSHKFKLYAILSSMMKSLTLLSCSVLDVNLLFVQYVCVLNTSQISFWLHGLDDLESPKANYPPFEVSSEGQL